ncbi:MAG: Endonuclease V [uncultured Sulfurovum sp.]|uniref:Endonuclease V n=1 Tax=uncultured Sulfurovum sp. TaxID=269237 RepID=A0A6S6SJH5_9BACT|nr:MAG: Endonuclease V [uncultured Sulfurovum sp.]
MKYVLDVQYNGDENAVVACLGFEKWEDEKAIYAKQHFIENILPYVSGAFYQRELPCLLEALNSLEEIECIVVDGYVWLDIETHKGLGLHLYEALETKVPIIGVAKAKFGNTPKMCELLRGKSVKPLYISTKDMDLEEAKKAIASMHGKYRFPTLLKEVDSLARKPMS